MNGRAYSNKYLVGKKRVNTSPTTIVEFVISIGLIGALKGMQMRIEEGAMSMGLGDKVGRGLSFFNKELMSGNSTFRSVKVKPRGPQKK